MDNTNIIFSTDTIFLRALTEADIPQWCQWFNMPQVTVYMNKGIFPNTEEKQREYLAHLLKSKQDVQYALCMHADKSFVGVIGLHGIDWVHRHASVSVVIGNQRVHNRGIATEAVGCIAEHAFLKMNLHRLSAGMIDPNAASRRCFEKNGFVYEGTQREAFYFQGTYVSVHFFGLLKDEWQVQRT